MKHLFATAIEKIRSMLARTPTGSAPIVDEAFAAYALRCEGALRNLFNTARTKEEVQFAASLNPEFRGMQDPGWNSAEESISALKEYKLTLANMPNDRMRVRIALSLYSHLSEASGFYEVPKNMLRIASGDDYNLWPFSHLVQRHATTGAAIAPNANKIMKDLLGHAEELGLADLREVILEAFDPDLRNGYAHADYIIWNDGIRLRKRNGGQPRIVPFQEFGNRLNKAIGFFDTIETLRGEYIMSYSVPRRVVGRLNSRNPAMPTIISYNPQTGNFSIQTGLGL